MTPLLHNCCPHHATETWLMWPDCSFTLQLCNSLARRTSIQTHSYAVYIPFLSLYYLHEDVQTHACTHTCQHTNIQYTISCTHSTHTVLGQVKKQLCAHFPSTQHLLVPSPQDSTCRRCLEMPNRCARKSFSAIRSFTRRPSASSLYLTTSSAMLPGASSLQDCNMTHKIYGDQLYNSEISLDEQYIRTQLLIKYLIAGCFDQKVLLQRINCISWARQPAVEYTQIHTAKWDCEIKAVNKLML